MKSKRGCGAAVGDTVRVLTFLQLLEQAGVQHFVVPGTTISSSMSVLELAKTQPSVTATAGVHPVRKPKQEVSIPAFVYVNYVRRSL